MTPRYAFMLTRPMDEISDEIYSGALAVVLDTSAKTLISDDRYTLAEATARMDHHLFVEKICDEEITATSYESCAGLVAAMAEACGFTVSDVAAKALYHLFVTVYPTPMSCYNGGVKPRKSLFHLFGCSAIRRCKAVVKSRVENGNEPQLRYLFIKRF